jgi:hypothetical protein
MKTLGISIFVILLIYVIVNYKFYDFNKRKTIYSVEYRPIPYSAFDMINETDIDYKINDFDSDAYAKYYKPEKKKKN